MLDKSDKSKPAEAPHCGAHAPAPASGPDDAQQETTSGLRMVLTMGGIGLVAGLLIVLTYQFTLPRIERNKAAALERAVFEVVPGARSQVAFALRDNVLEPDEAGEKGAEHFYACYDDAGDFVGVAIEASGQGFQDVIRLLYGYSPENETVVGLKILESKETPGLGDKISKDPAFQSNFAALDVRLDGGAPAHPVSLAKHGEKHNAWEVEAITGATISSRAVTRIIRESTAHCLPIVRRNLDALRKGNP